MFVCCNCGRDLALKMEYIGTPIDQEREYYCLGCGKVYKGTPKTGKYEEVKTIVEKELK